MEAVLAFGAVAVLLIGYAIMVDWLEGRYPNIEVDR